MNKKELDAILKKSPKKTISKYEQYKQEITYLFENNATLNVISDFLFDKYGLIKANTTLHYYIQRHVVEPKAIQKEKKPIQIDDSKKNNVPSGNSNRYTMETAKRQMAK